MHVNMSNVIRGLLSVLVMRRNIFSHKQMETRYK
jgi:hypothetical protein